MNTEQFERFSISVGGFGGRRGGWMSVGFGECVIKGGSKGELLWMLLGSLSLRGVCVYVSARSTFNKFSNVISVKVLLSVLLILCVLRIDNMFKEIRG